MIGESSSEATATAVHAFVSAVNDGDSDLIAETSDEFTAACDDAGWTPPEG